MLALALVTVTASSALIAQAPDQAAMRDKVLQFVRTRFNIPQTVKLTMTDPRDSAFTDFLETTVTVDDGKTKQSQPLFISKNLRYIVEGSIFNLGGDSPQEIMRLISVKDQPAQGPASAPVTLVEYSDLQCPVCAQMQQELESDIVPKYGNKLRIVFKEFPLVTIHDWALTGAIAAQCIYQMDPSKYPDFRTQVYKNQADITGDRARDMLLHFGAEAGVDNDKLAACIDSRQTLSRVEANMHEGEALGIGQTPTSYINGKMLIGAPPSAEIYKAIDEALREVK
jgi:protein-disulfide isomerase